MRARIDISEIEAETKIRAKYLRALENEEWGLLPGPTYVRSFLRTYAEALGLDAKLLLEEYKLRHERPSDHDLMPISAQRRRGGGGLGPARPARQRPPRGVPRGLVVGVIVAALIAALYALGQTGGDDGGGASSGRTDTVSTTTVPKRTPAATSTNAAKSTKRTKKKPAASARLVRLQIVPTGPVYVCLQAAGGQMRLPGVTLQPGSTSGTYRSSQFKLRLGNGNARLRVDGKLRTVADASPIAYVIKKGSVTRIDPAQSPTCVR
jgi:hypothetical protein